MIFKFSSLQPGIKYSRPARRVGTEKCLQIRLRRCLLKKCCPCLLSHLPGWPWPGGVFLQLPAFHFQVQIPWIPLQVTIATVQRHTPVATLQKPNRVRIQMHRGYSAQP